MDTMSEAKDTFRRIMDGESAYDVLYDKMYSPNTALEERIAQDAWCDKQVSDLNENQDKVLQSFINYTNTILKTHKEE